MSDDNGFFHRGISSSRPTSLDAIVATLLTIQGDVTYKLIDNLQKPPYNEFTIPAIVAIAATMGLVVVGYVGSRLLSIYVERENKSNHGHYNGPNEIYNQPY